ncbi:hypothetical protein C8Q73DRAFT_792861 [Cubamyces lactineus]|nr:hypothetical protein C8Q73DRAFT_792861 [Cubamyces lactineus]
MGLWRPFGCPTQRPASLETSQAQAQVKRICNAQSSRSPQHRMPMVAEHSAICRVLILAVNLDGPLSHAQLSTVESGRRVQQPYRGHHTERSP